MKGWKQKLTNSIKDDNKFFFRACGLAERASDFILQRDQSGVPKYLKNMLKESPKKTSDRPPAKSSNKKVKPIQTMGKPEVVEAPFKLNGDGILTADEILNTNFETLPFNGKWEELC